MQTKAGFAILPRRRFAAHSRLWRAAWPTIASFICVLLAASLAQAQATDGNLVGVVTDMSGGVVPNAAVGVTNAATQVKTRTSTGGNGEYRLNDLPVGSYDLTVAKEGFHTITLRSVEVRLNFTSTSNVALDAQGPETTIEVLDVPVLIDTTSAQIGATFGVREAIDVPSSASALGVLNLSLLGAGVANAGALGQGDGPSIGGQRPRNNSFTIEGVNDDRRDITGHNIAVPNEAVAEFTLLQNQFSPEFGNATGGQFNTVVKSGGNEFHGSVYEYLANRHFNAVDNLTVVASKGAIRTNPRYDSNTPGGSIGGPIIKDKLFFYGLWQYSMLGMGAVSSSGAVFAPTADGYAMLGALPGVSQTNLGVLKQYLPAAATPSKTTPVCPQLAATACTAATPGAFLIPLGVYPVVAPSYGNLPAYVISLDYDISSSDQMRGRVLGSLSSGFNLLPQLPAFFQPRKTNSYLVALSEFHSFTPSWLNEFRFGYQRYNDDILAGNYKFPNLDAFPNIVIATDLNVQLGPYQTSPQATVLNTYQLLDNVSWTHGAHAVKFGWEGRKYIDSSIAIQRVRGDYQYSTLGQFILDYTPDRLAERNVGVAPYSGNAIDTSLFVNDIYRLRPNFTLNAGVRWTYQGVPYADTQWALNSLASVPGLIDFRVPSAQLNAFAPRAGLAYSPGTSGKTSIRAGFGMAYDKVFENIGQNVRPPEISTQFDSSPLGGNTPGYLASGGIPAGTTVPAGCTGAAQCRARTSGYVFDQQLPYALTWNAGVEHVIHKDYTLRVEYLGTKGVHLYAQTRLNVASSVTPTNFIPTFLTAPSPTALAALPNLGVVAQAPSILPQYAAAGFTGPLTAYQNRGNSDYHGLATELTRRFARGVLFKAAYTWSHNLDDSTADVASTVLSPRRPQDFQDMAAEKSDSFLDRRHRFTFMWVYDTPWFAKSGSKLLRAWLGGYIVSGIYTYESPQYATVQSGVDSNLNGDSVGDRSVVNVNGTPGIGSAVQPLASDGSLVTANTSCTVGASVAKGSACTVAYVATNPNAQYIVAGLGALATGGRQTMAFRPINDWDVQFKKQFVIRERFKLQFAAQFFNLFNHPQYVSGYLSNISQHSGNATNNNLIPNSPIFNDPTSVFSSNPRSTQFTARIEF